MKKSFVKSLSLFIGGGVLLYVSLALASCGEDSGLGASIDTDAPVISITYPPSNAVVRDSFIFGGEWSDDKSLNRIDVSVAIVNSDDTTTTVYETTASIAKVGTWQVSLNPYDESNPYNGYKFADGVYEISARAYDDAGHDSGLISRMITVDNTAPVLILTKPTTVGSNSPKAYGRTVQLEGLFSESCTTGISKLLVSFYNENGEGLLDAEFKNITDMTHANPLIIAQYYDEKNRNSLTAENKVRWQNYLKLYTQANVTEYENGTANTEKIYFTVTASDAAAVYKDFDGKTAVEGGNSTSTYYRGTTDLLRLVNSTNEDFPNFTVLSLQSYLNKSEKDYLTNDALAGYLKEAVSNSTSVSLTPAVDTAVLSNNEAENGLVYLNFAINPENNPKYVVTGMAVDSTGKTDDQYNEGYFYYYSGSPVSVSFNYGLDQVNLDTSTISVYFEEVTTNEAGEESYGEEKLLWTYNKDVAIEYAMSKNNALTKETAEDAVDASPENYKYTVTGSDENTDSFSFSQPLTTDDGIQTGKKYKFSVKGYDIDGQSIIPTASAGYGIFVRSAIPVPDIKIGNTDNYENMENMTAFSNAVFNGSNIKFSGTVSSEEALKTDEAMWYQMVLKDGSDSANTATVTGEITVTNEQPETADSKTTYDWNFTFDGTAQKLQNVITKGANGGLFTVAFTIYAKNGGGSTKTDLTYYLDTKKSEIINLALSANQAGYSAYKDSTGTYYINNSEGTFTLTGTTIDNYKFGSTTVKILDSDGSEKSSATASDQAWKFDRLSFSDCTTSATIVLSTTDEAGNEHSESISVKFDTTPPAWEQAKFLIKNAAYSETANWFKETSLSVKGYCTEEGSGVSTVYYWIQTPSSSAPQTTRDAFDTANGSFTNLTKDSSNTAEYYFTNNLGSFEENSNNKGNTLYLVVVDKVGNVSSPQTFEINLDIESPTFVSNKSGNAYTNKVSDITVEGTYEDNASGLDTSEGNKSLVFTLNKQTVAANLTPDANDSKKGTWAVTLAAQNPIISSLKDGETYNVEATITDKAGNASSLTVFSLTTDTTAPKVTITEPAPSSTINGTVKIQGTGNDYSGALPNKFQLYYSKTAPTSETTLDSLTAIGSELDTERDSIASIYSWEFSDENVKDDAGVTEEAPSKKLYIIPAIYDEAGNCNLYTEKYVNGDLEKTYSYTKGTNYFEYTVDQNTDRPIVQFTSITGSGAWLGSAKTVSGTISDDDGIASFQISENDGTSWNDVTVSNSSWSYTLKSNDATDIELTFKIKDTAGTEFVSKNTSVFAMPYFLYSGQKASDEAVTTQHSSYTDYGIDSDSNHKVLVNIDSKIPELGTLGIDIAESASALASSETVKTSPEKYTISTSDYAGGNSKYIKFYVPAYDANMSGVKIYIEQVSNGVNQTKLLKDSAGKEIKTEEISLTKQDGVTTGTNPTFTYWESEALDVSGLSTSTKKVYVVATDTPGNEGRGEATFWVDNAGPDTLTITSPSSTDSLTGTVRIYGSARDSESGLALVEWLVPPTGYADKDAATYDWVSKNNYGTVSAPKFVFLSGDEYDFTNYDDPTKYAVTKNANGTYKIPIYFRLTDKLGNTSIVKTFYITHDPDADRPVTTLLYPTESDYDKKNDNGTITQSDFITLAGNIRINGSAVVPSKTAEIGMVYIQIGDASGSSPVWAYNSLPSALQAEITKLGGYKTAASLKNDYANTIYVDSDWWGIPVSSKKAWNAVLNSNGDLNPASDTPRPIVIRACAINEFGKMGIWTDPVYIHVDSNAPSQSAEVRRYTDGGFKDSEPDSNILSSKEFTTGMYLSKTRYLAVTLEDNDSLEEDTLEVKMNSSTVSSSNYTLDSRKWYQYSDSETWTTEEDNSKTLKKIRKKLYIPIDTESLSYKSVTYTVYIADSSGYSTFGTYLFNIDNTAPEISTLEGNGSSLLVNSNVPAIENTNYAYVLSSKVAESGSGLEKFFFYFLRDASDMSGDTDSRILDAVLDYNNGSGYSYDTTKIAKLDKYEITGAGNLYGKTISGSLNSARTTFTPTTASDITGNKHIRAGGLIYIGGEYQIITSLNSSTGAVTFANAISEIISVTEAGFPYGQVINETNESTSESVNTSTGTYTITNDDGDTMPETFKEDTNSYTVSGTIYSDRMADGPVKLVCIVFDVAGNVSGKTVTTQIKNHAPRLAKLYLGTDLTGDGIYSDADGEFNTYSFATVQNDGTIKNDNYKAFVSFKTDNSDNKNFSTYGKSFKIRSGLAVVPELTGGNGTIKMAWLKAATSDTAITKENATGKKLYEAEDANSTRIREAFSVSTRADTNKADTIHKFVIPDDDFKNNNVGDDSADMSFTFWDSTEGKTIGEDTQNCFVRITDFVVDRGDITPPNSVIDPFYWKSASDNSVYGKNTKNGHIELEKDWTAKKDSTNLASGYTGAIDGIGDGDPKVSGKITMTGYAFDNQRLSSLWVAFDDFGELGGYLSSGGDAAATASSTTASNGTYSYNGATYYQVAYYTPGTGWTSASPTMAGNNWEFALDTNGTEESPAYLNQSGHKVFWTLSFDTEKITGTAGTDKSVRVIAFDHNYNVVSVAETAIKTPYALSSALQGEGTDNAPYYRMDIVPYITGVTTTLSKSNTGSTKGVYDRTALGHYPVYLAHATESANDTLTLTGFNLKAGATVTLNGTEYSSGLVASGSAYTFALPDNATSGKLSVTVNGVVSLNNTNNNGSKGSYEYGEIGANGNYTAYSNYYNRQPNNKNNNILTDDVEIDVWQFNSAAALAYENGKVDNLEMKINPKNGMIGFAFSNGTLRFAMPSSDMSYRQWNMSYDYMSHNALAFDADGNSYAVSVGGDINDSGNADDFSFMTSRWNVVGEAQGSNTGTTNHLRLDTIGQGSKGDNNSARNKERFQSPSFALHTSASDSTDVYLAYYDLLNSEIRFKAGNIDSTSSADFGNFKDIGNNDPNSYEKNSKDCQIIAKGASSAATNTLGTAGQYVSIGVTSSDTAADDNVVVIVWYDGKNLMYAYNKTPLDNVNQTSVTYAANTGWTGKKKLLSNSGEYCQLAVASDGSIHVACYNSAKSNLEYVYIPKYDSEESAIITATVDSYLDVGEQLTIDVAMNGTDTTAKPIPYIGYWGAYPEKPRYAYLADPATFYGKTTVHGAIKDTYTGVWECSVVPTQSSVKDSRKMNVGVWKNGGVLDNSKTGTFTATPAHGLGTETTPLTVGGGTCYGNGTSNGVMAYVVAPSSSQYNAETAQKR